MKMAEHVLKYGRVFDSIISQAKISLAQQLVESIMGAKAREMPKNFYEKHKDGIYKVMALLRSKESEATVTMYTYNGVPLAAILEVKGQKKYNGDVLNFLSKFEEAGYSIQWIDYYKLPRDIVADILGEDTLKDIEKSLMKKEEAVEKIIEEVKTEEPKEIKEEKKVVQQVVTVTVEKAIEKPPAKPIVKPKPLVDIKKELFKLLEDVGFEPINVDVKGDTENVEIIVDMPPSMPWLEPKDMLYIVAEKYISLVGTPSFMRLEIRFSSELTEEITLTSTVAFAIARIIGRSLKRLLDEGIGVTGTQHTISPDGNTIIVRFKVKKTTLAGINVRDLLMQIYDDVKRFWKGILILSIKTGRFGREIRVP